MNEQELREMATKWRKTFPTWDMDGDIASLTHLLKTVATRVERETWEKAISLAKTVEPLHWETGTKNKIISALQSAAPAALNTQETE